MPFLCTVASFPAVSDMCPLRLDQSRNFPCVKSEYLGEQAHREEHKDCTFGCWTVSAQYLWKGGLTNSREQDLNVHVSWKCCCNYEQTGTNRGVTYFIQAQKLCIKLLEDSNSSKENLFK